jgi:hypothetical protein
MVATLANRMSWKLGALAILVLAYIYQDRLRTYFPTSLFTFQSNTTMSTQQKALYLVEPQGDFEVRSRDIQEPGPGEVLVEIHATALNPVDWKIQAYNLFIKDYPTILGTDSAGIVKKVGEGVTNVAVGDKVCVRPSTLHLKHPNATV